MSNMHLVTRHLKSKLNEALVAGDTLFNYQLLQPQKLRHIQSLLPEIQPIFLIQINSIIKVNSYINKKFAPPVC
jgi:hypothetical protein